MLPVFVDCENAKLCFLNIGPTTDSFMNCNVKTLRGRFVT